MSFQFYIEQKQWQRLLQAHKKWLEAVRPTGGLSRLLFGVAERGRDAAEVKTHKVTGALASSHRVIFSPRGIINTGAPEAVIYVDALTNPMHGLPTTEYAEIEEARGGDHAFYELVIVEDMQSIVEKEVEANFRGIFG